MGLFAYTMAGGGFILVGAWELFSSCRSLFSSLSFTDSNPASPSSVLPNRTAKHGSILQSSNRTQNLVSSPALFTYVISACFSVMFMFNSLVSVYSAVKSNDRIGSSLQFQVLAISSIFLLYSILGLITKLSNLVYFPSEIVNLILLFGFVEEFLLFYLQRKDTSGIENRYYDLMLLPISICVFSTVFQVKSSPRSSFYPRMTRGVGLIMQGLWFFQMGISFYSSWISNGCNLTQKSRGNFTIKCKGHMEYHRGRGIATVLFNCHLGFMVTALCVAYFLFVNKNQEKMGLVNYKPLGQEVNHSIETGGTFSLDSEDDDENGIKEVDRNTTKTSGGAVELATNGHWSQE